MSRNPIIYSKTEPLMGNNPNKFQDSLKVKIVTQPGETNRKMVPLYLLILKTSSDEALSKVLVILKKILKVNNLNTGSQWCDTTNNLLTREALQVFKKKSKC